ncbi:HAMP domain-containing protein [Candidatus Roizmanbacteria bacterium]|nr:HAMP domain-containing protein [Candidatus Roizmanbacteria bacterium]
MFHSLITRLIVAMITLLIGGVFIYTYFNVNRQQDILIKTARENTELLMSTVERSILNNMNYGSSHNVKTILELLGHHNQLINVNIVNMHGIILHSSNPSNVGSKVNMGICQLSNSSDKYAIFSNSTDGEILSMVKPIYNNVTCHVCHGSKVKVIALLRVNYSLNYTKKQILDSSRIFIISSIAITVFLSIMISLILLMLVKKPLNKMISTMSIIEQGNLNVHIEYERKDEIGMLINSFNSMVDRLNLARMELEQLHFEQLERADRLSSIGEMAAGIAHEIKNPLAGIYAAVSVIKNETLTDDVRASILGEVLEQVQRLDKTTNDLLFLGKPSLPELACVDIESILNKTIRFASLNQNGAHIEQRLELEGGLPPVYVDKKQIQQVFLNLLLNAFQSMYATGGILLVRTSRSYHDDNEFVRIDFSDSGPGIPPKILDSIFNPFFTTKAHGTGLGLTICLKLVRLHNGNISVVSDSSGTVFTVELPTCNRANSETSEASI